MDAFAGFDRDNSLMCQCIKCQVAIAKVQILSVYKTGFYICEPCYTKLESVYKTKGTEIIEL